MTLRRYRHIIWDWNGTLLDDLDLCIEVVNGMLQRRKLEPMDRARYHAAFDFPVRDYYRRIGLESTGEDFHALSVEFISGYEARRLEARLHPGCDALLAALNAAGLTQSILSAYHDKTLREIVGHFGIIHRFTRLSGLDNIYAQSKAALGRRCLVELELPASAVLLVGDTLHDLEVARELGVDCMLVAHGHHPDTRLRERCAHVFADLAALAAALGVTLAEEAVAASGSSNPGG